MKTTGAILQIIALAGLAIGVLIGVLQVASRGGGESGLAIVAGSAIGGLVLHGIGGVFVSIAEIATDARRAADALDRLSQRRRNDERPPAPPA